MKEFFMLSNLHYQSSKPTKDKFNHLPSLATASTMMLVALLAFVACVVASPIPSEDREIFEIPNSNLPPVNIEPVDGVDGLSAETLNSILDELKTKLGALATDNNAADNAANVSVDTESQPPVTLNVGDVSIPLEVVNTGAVTPEGDEQQGLSVSLSIAKRDG